ncbi:MAG: epoxyqueuosine reductase QueH [bacterium]
MSVSRILLHICCGPCATGVVPRLQELYQVMGFFYNPNIFPDDEFRRRKEAAGKLAFLWRFPVEYGVYDHTRFREMVRGLEDEPEGGRRCEICFRLRLEKCAERAQELGCRVMASTLTIGPKKRADVINRIGREVARSFGVEFLEADWKKRDGFKQSVELSRKMELYRQCYCGCEFSQKGRAGRGR